jgi:hypothetical protein
MARLILPFLFDLLAPSGVMTHRCRVYLMENSCTGTDSAFGALSLVGRRLRLSSPMPLRLPGFIGSLPTKGSPPAGPWESQASVVPHSGPWDPAPTEAGTTKFLLISLRLERVGFLGIGRVPLSTILRKAAGLRSRRFPVFCHR